MARDGATRRTSVSQSPQPAESKPESPSSYFDSGPYLGDLAWKTAVIARGPTYSFFEHLRTITAYAVFQDWPHLLRSIADAAIRPP